MLDNETVQTAPIGMFNTEQELGAVGQLASVGELEHGGQVQAGFTRVLTGQFACRLHSEPRNSCRRNCIVFTQPTRNRGSHAGGLEGDVAVDVVADLGTVGHAEVVVVVRAVGQADVPTEGVVVAFQAGGGVFDVGLDLLVVDAGAKAQVVGDLNAHRRIDVDGLHIRGLGVRVASGREEGGTGSTVGVTPVVFVFDLGAIGGVDAQAEGHAVVERHGHEHTAHERLHVLEITGAGGAVGFEGGVDPDLVSGDGHLGGVQAGQGGGVVPLVGGVLAEYRGAGIGGAHGGYGLIRHAKTGSGGGTGCQ